MSSNFLKKNWHCAFYQSDYILVFCLHKAALDRVITSTKSVVLWCSGVQCCPLATCYHVFYNILLKKNFSQCCRWQIAVRRTAKGIVLFPEKKRKYMKILAVARSDCEYSCTHIILYFQLCNIFPGSKIRLLC